MTRGKLTQLCIIGVGLSLVKISIDALGGCSRGLSESSTVPTLAVNPARGCDEALLDAHDARFDARRAARQSVVARAGNETAPKVVYDMFEPEANCFSDERFGGGTNERFKAYGDGPKFVCGVDYLASRAGKAQNGCLVYSIGSNNQIAFEISVKAHIGCEVHTFDPTLDRPFIGNQYASFHPWGLGEDGRKHSLRNHTWTAMSLTSMTKNLGHSERRIDILKVDCEGCEWVVFPEIFGAIQNGDLDVAQIQVELHGAGRFYRVRDFFADADRARMRIVHKERNHWGCDGYHCLEYSLVSEAFLKEANLFDLCNESV